MSARQETRPAFGAKAFIPNEAGAYLFLRRRTPRPDGSEWDLPGGRIDPSAKKRFAELGREVREETGLHITGTPELIGMQTIYEPDTIRLSYLVNAAGTLSLSDEHLGAAWLPPEAWLAQPGLDPYIRQLLWLPETLQLLGIAYADHAASGPDLERPPLVAAGIISAEEY
jgi:8-oxo-dGTP pyrophosphatase MutT (NUDIX family)